MLINGLKKSLRFVGEVGRQTVCSRGPGRVLGPLTCPPRQVEDGSSLPYRGSVRRSENEASTRADQWASPDRRNGGRARIQRRRPPISEPSTPRTISRPTVEPTVRAALFAIASTMLSLRPLPVMRPPSESLIESMIPPPAAPAGAVD